MRVYLTWSNCLSDGTIGAADDLIAGYREKTITTTTTSATYNRKEKKKILALSLKFRHRTIVVRRMNHARLFQSCCKHPQTMDQMLTSTAGLLFARENKKRLDTSLWGVNETFLFYGKRKARRPHDSPPLTSAKKTTDCLALANKLATR